MGCGRSEVSWLGAPRRAFPESGGSQWLHATHRHPFTVAGPRRLLTGLPSTTGRMNGCILPWPRAGVVSEGTTKGEKMHKARYTAGQRVLDSTGNLKAVQKLLGHRSMLTTADVYLDWDTPVRKPALQCGGYRHGDSNPGFRRERAAS